MALTRDQKRANARRTKAIRNLPEFRQRVSNIEDHRTVAAIDDVWDVLESLQDRMLKPAKPQFIRKSKNKKVGNISSSIGTMRVKEKGDGFGGNAIEIMGNHNWKKFRAKLPSVSDLKVDDWQDPESTELNLNDNQDRIAELETQVKSLTSACNTLLQRLDNKDVFDLEDVESQVDQDISVGKPIG